MMNLGLLGLLGALQVASPQPQQAQFDSSREYAAQIENLIVKNTKIYTSWGDSVRKGECWADTVLLGNEEVLAALCKSISQKGIERRLDVVVGPDSGPLFVIHDWEVIGHSITCSFLYRGITADLLDPRCEMVYQHFLGPIKDALKNKYARKSE